MSRGDRAAVFFFFFKKDYKFLILRNLLEPFPTGFLRRCWFYSFTTGWRFCRLVIIAIISSSIHPDQHPEEEANGAKLSPTFPNSETAIAWKSNKNWNRVWATQSILVTSLNLHMWFVHRAPTNQMMIVTECIHDSLTLYCAWGGMWAEEARPISLYNLFSVPALRDDLC